MEVKKILRTFSRFSDIIKPRELYFSSQIISHCLQYNQHGNPTEVLEFKERKVRTKLKSDEILVKMKSGVIHPSEINTVMGNYPNKPKLPAIFGNEGYGEVISVGKNSKFNIGDQVAPYLSTTGVFTSYKIYQDCDIIKVPDLNDPEVGAILVANPCTAYRILKDFVHLNKGDWVIQTGGTSAVGIYTIQLAKKWGIKTASIIRARESQEDTDKVKDNLKDFGADFVFTEQEAGANIKGLGAKLAVNCVGGRALYPLFCGLSPSSTIVTYGAMNFQPLSIPVSSLIFNDFVFRGFWLAKWVKENVGGSAKQVAMIDDLVKDFNNGTLRPSPYKKYSLKNEWQEIIKNSTFSDANPTGIAMKNIVIMDMDE